MNIIIAILTLSLVVCIGIIYDQHSTIKLQRRRLLETLEWIDPADLVKGDWSDD